MEESTVSFRRLASTSKQLAKRLATIGENRLELLTVELQEERQHLRDSILMAFGVTAFGLLAALTLSAAIVVLLWAWSPIAVLLTLTGFYAAAALSLWWKLKALLGGWETLSASIDQLRKDRACLEDFLA